MKVMECPKCGDNLQISKSGQAMVTCLSCRYEINIREETSGGWQSILQRGNLSVEYGEWADATNSFNKVLDHDPENAEAYLGKLLAEIRSKEKSTLINHWKVLDEYPSYQKAIRFGDDNLKKELTEYNEQIKVRLEEKERIQKLEEEEKKQVRKAEAEAAAEEKERIRKEEAEEKERALNEEKRKIKAQNRKYLISEIVKTSIAILLLIGLTAAYFFYVNGLDRPEDIGVWEETFYHIMLPFAIYTFSLNSILIFRIEWAKFVLFTILSSPVLVFVLSVIFDDDSFGGFFMIVFAFITFTLVLLVSAIPALIPPAIAIWWDEK